MIDSNHPDLPDELREAQPRSEEGSAEHFRELQKLGKLIAEKRDAAVKARKESGIEDIWTACEENYAGIDDLNRVEGGSQQWRKPTSPTGPLTRGVGKDAEQRSTVFIRLTTRYVDMGAAKVKEKALPIGDNPVDLKPTAVPELVDSGAESVAPPPGGQPGAQPGPAMPPIGGPPSPGMQPAAPMGMPGPMPGMPGMPPPMAQTPVADASKQVAATARKAAEKASTRIFDWLTESKYPQHIRRVIDDGARIGVGVLKGPFPDNRSAKSFTVKDVVKDGKPAKEGILEVLQYTAPGCVAIDPWNFFPSGSCGEDIHRGPEVLERDFLAESRLEDLKKLRGLPTADHPDGEPIYLADQIDMVVRQGPEKCKERGNEGPHGGAKKDLYTIWHYTGQMSRKDMISMGAIGAAELPDDVVTCHAIVTLVNDTVIRAQMNPLEKSGNFPYRVFQWSRRAGHWAGVGVAEQVMVPQNMVNAGTRAWLNNAGVSSGAQIIFDQSKLEPMDKSHVIGGGVKVWQTTAEAAGVDVRTLFTSVAIPNMGQELMAIIQYAFKLAEEMSNIPLVSQGQTGPNDPQTFGQAELQNSNANTLLREIADRLDGDVIEPTVDDFYEWLLLDPEIPLDEKGDFKVVSKGCSAMVEKAIQEQVWIQVLGLAPNPAYGLSPALAMEQVLRSKRLDPETVKLTEEEKAAMASKPPPEAPAVAAAKIRAESAAQIADKANQTKTAIAARDTDRDASYNALLAKREEIARQTAIDDFHMKRELLLLEYANKRAMSLDDAKVVLAKTSLELRAQMQLAGSDGHAPQVATPAIEPPGQAHEGMAFQE